MPIFQLVIEKKFGEEYWVNDYYLEATDIDDANSKSGPIVDAERSIHRVGVVFTKYRVSTVVPDDGIFRNYNINLQGQKSIGGEMVALFNVLRVDVTAASGRGGRKYLRGVLGEEEINFNVIIPSAVSTYETMYCNVLDALDYLVKKDGVELDDWSVFPFVAMRQLRRGSRRRTTPII